jgi:shikimate kinase
VKRHVVLVGLPGSGKTTVGRRAAELLRTAFTDIDQIVVSAAGMPVAELFLVQGEPQFRRLERAAMDGAMAAPPHVVAPGAGWAAEPGNLEATGDALQIYLRISPAAAAARLRGDVSRPLLAGEDPEQRIGELLAKRETWYRRAMAEVEAGIPVEVVAGAVVRLAREKAGW